METLKESRKGYRTVAIIRPSPEHIAPSYRQPNVLLNGVAAVFDLSGGGAFCSTDTTPASALAQDAAEVVATVTSVMYSIMCKARTAERHS